MDLRTAFPYFQGEGIRDVRPACLEHLEIGIAVIRALGYNSPHYNLCNVSPAT